MRCRVAARSNISSPDLKKICDGSSTYIETAEDIAAPLDAQPPFKVVL